MGLLALFAGSALVLLWMGSENPTTDRGTGPGAGIDVPEIEPGGGETRLSTPSGTGLKGLVRETQPTAPGRAEVPGDLSLGNRPLRTPPNRFVGANGSLRGTVEVKGSVVFPRSWSLVLSPSSILIGSETAEARRVEFNAGEREFHIEDLPLAGYDVRAVAEGMNCASQPILIERTSAHPFIVLHLTPAGFLEGDVADQDGVPLDGVPVVVESAQDGRRWEAESDALGRWRVDDLPDGQYKVLLGHPHSPIDKPEWIRFQAPSMRLPPKTVPTMAAIDIRVIDMDNRAVADARITGSGNAGGYISGTSDPTGHFLARYLPEGRYRLSAQHPQAGKRRQAVDIKKGDITSIVIQLRP